MQQINFMLPHFQDRHNQIPTRVINVNNTLVPYFSDSLDPDNTSGKDYVSDMRQLLMRDRSTGQTNHQPNTTRIHDRSKIYADLLDPYNNNQDLFLREIDRYPGNQVTAFIWNGFSTNNTQSIDNVQETINFVTQNKPHKKMIIDIPYGENGRKIQVAVIMWTNENGKKVNIIIPMEPVEDDIKKDSHIMIAAIIRFAIGYEMITSETLFLNVCAKGISRSVTCSTIIESYFNSQTLQANAAYILYARFQGVNPNHFFPSLKAIIFNLYHNHNNVETQINRELNTPKKITIVSHQAFNPFLNMVGRHIGMKHNSHNSCFYESDASVQFQENGANTITIDLLKQTFHRSGQEIYHGEEAINQIRQLSPNNINELSIRIKDREEDIYNFERDFIESSKQPASGKQRNFRENVARKFDITDNDQMIRFREPGSDLMVTIDIIQETFQRQNQEVHRGQNAIDHVNSLSINDINTISITQKSVVTANDQKVSPSPKAPSATNSLPKVNSDSNSEAKEYTKGKEDLENLYPVDFDKITSKKTSATPKLSFKEKDKALKQILGTIKSVTNQSRLTDISLNLWLRDLEKYYSKPERKGELDDQIQILEEARSNNTPLKDVFKRSTRMQHAPKEHNLEIIAKIIDKLKEIKNPLIIASV